MQTTLLKLLCEKNALAYIIFDTNFLVLETNKEGITQGSDIHEYLWEIVGLEDKILHLNAEKKPIVIPMIFRDGFYYDLEIASFTNHKNQVLFIATMQQKSKYSQEYADVIKKINKKTLVYELSDEKKQNSSYQEINKHLITLHVDLDGYITMINEAALHFFNLEREEMLGKHFSTFFQPQKSQLSTTNIFIAKNSSAEDIFFYADIIPLTNKNTKVFENIIIAQNITHLKKIKHELEYAQEHDTLTGLANRHHFLKLLDKRIEENKEFFLCFIDIDDFHTVNDEYGAHAADMLLKHLSKLLLEFIEAGDMLMRIHADTFTIIFETGKNREYIEILLKKLPTLFTNNPLYYSDEDIIRFNCTNILLSYPYEIKESKETLALAQKLLQRKKIEKKELHR
ncbi:hypothetical protein MNB_SM-7-606 [hydrothermal vent metagenome]|uniref:Uncharacterized protein n=1 Tax=hydrothermal vent metagenome TaxID=652676 RepID=A0A1W1BQ41_9ZZZZ